MTALILALPCPVQEMCNDMWAYTPGLIIDPVNSPDIENGETKYSNRSLRNNAPQFF
jgi:hypothetical protein